MSFHKLQIKLAIIHRRANEAADNAGSYLKLNDTLLGSLFLSVSSVAEDVSDATLLKL